MDDVPTNRDLLDELLSRMGFSTRTAASGEEAIVVHDEWHPDLVLMDVRMPGIGGLEGVRRLRQSGSKAAIIAVTASGLAEAEMRRAKPAWMRSCGSRTGKASCSRSSASGWAFATSMDRRRATVGSRRSTTSARRSTLSQRLSSLPPALIDQLREAAIEGRAKRLESLADQVGQHSEAVSAEIRALARDFQYDSLVSALRPSTRDPIVTVAKISR